MEATKRYVLIEKEIPFDNDDFYVWANIYYDLQEKQVFVSKFGHGDNCKFVDESTEDINLINKEDFCKSMLNTFSRFNESFYMDNFFYRYFSESYCPLFIPCVVNKGRKFKGNLTLICYEQKLNKFASRYRMVYDTYAIVWDKVKNQSCRINPSYIEFGDNKEQLRDIIYHSLLLQPITRLAHLYAYSISYYSCDTRNLDREITNIVGTYLKKLNKENQEELDRLNVVNIDDLREIKKAKEKNEKKWEANKDNVYAWAKAQLPNGTEEQVQNLVDKVKNKYYK